MTTYQEDAPVRAEETSPPADMDISSPGIMLRTMMQRRYAKLGPTGWYDELPHMDTPAEGDEDSMFIPGPGSAALAQLEPSHWSDLRAAYADRLRDATASPGDAAAGEPVPNLRVVPDAPDDTSLRSLGVPGQNNWVPLGPSALLKGQAKGLPPVSGRALRLAVVSANRVYVATADGGVWRTDDAGQTWTNTMDNFEVDPTAYASTSKACGAIAVDYSPSHPESDRVYVGTGEGDTFTIFNVRITGALPSYHGIGPLRSDDGGATWHKEDSNPSLVGAAFFGIVIDVNDKENAVAATTKGLYRRQPKTSGGGYQWNRLDVGASTDIFTSVIAIGAGLMQTEFYTATAAGKVYWSTDAGATWSDISGGLPTQYVARVTLASRPAFGTRERTNIYAIVAKSDNTFMGLYRRGQDLTFREVPGLPGADKIGKQATYNLPLAVDPHDINVVYIGGAANSTATSPDNTAGDAAIFRCQVTEHTSGNPPVSSYSMTTTYIGTGVHADQHDFQLLTSSTLWVANDGGVWRSTSPSTDSSFVHRNAGLSTICGNYFSQHPTQPAVITLGLQDNGVARYTGEEAWTRIGGGDGSATIINWNDPKKVLISHNGGVYGATDEGQGVSSFSQLYYLRTNSMMPPLAGTRYNPRYPADAETIAVAYGTSSTPPLKPQIIYSDSWGATSTWYNADTNMTENVFCLTFGSPFTLYAGTVSGKVYRYDRNGYNRAFVKTRLDNARGGVLGEQGIITDIAVDLADSASNRSIYVTFGGNGATGTQRPHVWHYDANQNKWESRSTGLLDLEHNAIVVDPAATSTLYVGTDIGVWQSTDKGLHWAPMRNGLPDAAVLDLQIHPTKRLLRASTYGRGMFEWKLDAPIQADVELYVKDTTLDLGRYVTEDGVPDPEVWPVQMVNHTLSRNIRIDYPDAQGHYQTPTTNIDFVQFNSLNANASSGTIVTIDPRSGVVDNHVFVEVHNRGVVEVDSVRVLLALTNASAGFMPLPAGYKTNIQNGTNIQSDHWSTVGIVTLRHLNNVRPQVAYFRLPSSMLPPPSSLPGQSHFCVMAFVHCAQDQYNNDETSGDLVSKRDRKGAQRNLHVVPFTGRLPPPGQGQGVWSRLDVVRHPDDKAEKELVFLSDDFVGAASVLVPLEWAVKSAVALDEKTSKVAEGRIGHIQQAWLRSHAEDLRTLERDRRFHPRRIQEMQQDLQSVGNGLFFNIDGRNGMSVSLRGLNLEAGKRYPCFIYFEPTKLLYGEPREVDVLLRDVETGEVTGGSRYSMNLTEDK